MINIKLTISLRELYSYAWYNYDTSGVRGLLFFTSLARIHIIMNFIEDVPEILSVYGAAKFMELL